MHPRKSWVRPALLHIIRLALANSMWNRFIFFSIPRYTTFAYPICFLTMRNACSTLQRTADLSCSIFLSQFMPWKPSAVLRLDGRLLIRNSILDNTSSSLISSRMAAPIVWADYFYPVRPWDYFIHSIEKLFSFGFLFTVGIFHICKCHLIHGRTTFCLILIFYHTLSGNT